MAAPIPPKSALASSGGPFEGFEAADFRAYEPQKQGSMKYNLERRKTKDKLLALARAVQASLEGDLTGLELHASDETPSVKNGKKVEHQLAVFLRDADDQRALRALTNSTNLQAGVAVFDIALEHLHACLELRVDTRGVSVGVEIAGRAKADRDNVVEKLKQSWAQGRVLELVKELPGPAKIGIEGALVDAEALTLADVESWSAAMSSPKALSALTLVAVDDVVALGPTAIESLGSLLRAYLPLYRFLAWAKDNEHAQVKEQIKKTTEQRQKKAVAFSPGDRVTILTGLFAGRAGYIAEIDAKSSKAKVMVGPVSLSIESKDLKSA